MNILFLTYQGYIAGSTHSISYLEGLSEKGHDIICRLSKRIVVVPMLIGTNVHLIPMIFKAQT